MIIVKNDDVIIIWDVNMHRSCRDANRQGDRMCLIDC